MTLRPYAASPARLARQLIIDLAVLTWVVTGLWLASQLHGVIRDVGSAGLRLRDGAGGVATHLRDAGADAARIPLAGDAISAPLVSAGGAADTLAAAGEELGDRVTDAALPAAVAFTLMAVVPPVVPWLLLRGHYARRAGSTLDLAGTPSGARLLALRALAGAPARRLTAIDPDPAGAWARGDDDVVAALAALELRRLGLPRPRD